MTGLETRCTPPSGIPETKAEAFSREGVRTGRKLLNVGCGSAGPERLPACFRKAKWEEVRVDIDPQVCPDIVASVTDLSLVCDGSMDAVWSSHNIEHLNSWEVPLALAEFRRVLKPHGFLLITLPDVRAIAHLIVADCLDLPLYHSAIGPITPLDILFGHQESLRRGRQHMAHRTAFTSKTLGEALIAAGFGEVRVHEGRHWDLWAVATMPETPLSVFSDMEGVAA